MNYCKYCKHFDGMKTCDCRKYLEFYYKSGDTPTIQLAREKEYLCGKEGKWYELRSWWAWICLNLREFAIMWVDDCRQTRFR